MTEVKTNV